MTDAISSIADQLLAMINSSPRTPTKAEIEGVLRALPEIMHPLLPIQHMNAGAAAYRKLAADYATALKQADASRESGLERRAVEIFNDLPQGSVCCPCTIDGSHNWTTNDAKGLRCQEGSEWDKGGPYWCPCGASKP